MISAFAELRPATESVRPIIAIGAIVSAITFLNIIKSLSRIKAPKRANTYVALIRRAERMTSTHRLEVNQLGAPLRPHRDTPNFEGLCAL